MSGRPPSGRLKNAWFAAWGHAAYKISSEIGINCRPGALTGLLFQRAPSPEISWRCQAATKTSNVQRSTFNTNAPEGNGRRPTLEVERWMLEVSVAKNPRVRLIRLGGIRESEFEFQY